MWGDETDKLKIPLNSTEFRVAQDLFDALRFLRRGPNRGPVWIGAISINQANIHERNWQLQMILHIYFCADTVLLWLGKNYSKYESAGAKGDVATGPEPARKKYIQRSH